MTIVLGRPGLPDAVLTGEEVPPRLQAGGFTTLTSGTLYVAYFTAQRTQLVGQLTALSRGAAATATTLCRYGLYSADSAGSGSLLGSTTADTTTFAATFTTYTRSLTTPVQVYAGQRYGFGILWVGTTGPQIYSTTNGADSASLPALSSQLTAQANLPATLSSPPATALQLYGKLQP